MIRQLMNKDRQRELFLKRSTDEISRLRQQQQSHQMVIFVSILLEEKMTFFFSYKILQNSFSCSNSSHHYWFRLDPLVDR